MAKPFIQLHLNQERRFRRLWAWFVAPAILVAVAAMAWLLTNHSHRPILASCLMIATVAWTLWQFAGASAWGIIISGLAAAILSAGFWTPVSPGIFSNSKPCRVHGWRSTTFCACRDCFPCSLDQEPIAMRRQLRRLHDHSVYRGDLLDIVRHHGRLLYRV